MKYLTSIYFIIIIILCTSCGFFMPPISNILRNMKCSEIIDMCLWYSVYSKQKPQNLLFYSNNKIGVYVDSYYNKTYKVYESYYKIIITKNELQNFGINYCQIVDSLKNRKIYTKKEFLFDYPYGLSSNTMLDFYRAENFGRFSLYHKSLNFKSLKVKGLYSNELYFKNAVVQTKIIEFANKIIVSKNKQIQDDITIADSLKIICPLIDANNSEIIDK